MKTYQVEKSWKHCYFFSHFLCYLCSWWPLIEIYVCRYRSLTICAVHFWLAVNIIWYRNLMFEYNHNDLDFIKFIYWNKLPFSFILSLITHPLGLYVCVCDIYCMSQMFGLKILTPVRMVCAYGCVWSLNESYFTPFSWTNACRWAYNYAMIESPSIAPRFRLFIHSFSFFPQLYWIISE